MGKKFDQTAQEEMVEGFRNSGLKRKEWCNKNGIGMSRLNGWISRKNKCDKDKQHRSGQMTQWVELVPSESPVLGQEETAICLFYKEFKIEVTKDFDPTLFQKVIQTVKEIC